VDSLAVDILFLFSLSEILEDSAGAYRGACPLVDYTIKGTGLNSIRNKHRGKNMMKKTMKTG
jgi:hypothetical protein